MFIIGYHSHVTGNAKAYQEALRQIRQWTYAHAGHRRSQVARHFAGGPKARNFHWQADDIIIQIRQLANIVTAFSIQIGAVTTDVHYHAQVFAYTTSWIRSATEDESEPKQYALASVVTQGLNFNAPWDTQQAGLPTLEYILETARNADRSSNGQPRPITAAPQSDAAPDAIVIAEASDLRQDTVPILAAPDSASPTLRQRLETELNWCDIGYADPSATIAIARSLPDPETASSWLKTECVTVVDETGQITTLPADNIDDALTELRQQYDNARIFQTINTIATLTEMLVHNTSPRNPHPKT